MDLTKVGSIFTAAVGLKSLERPFFISLLKRAMTSSSVSSESRMAYRYLSIWGGTQHPGVKGCPEVPHWGYTSLELQGQRTAPAWPQGSGQADSTATRFTPYLLTQNHGRRTSLEPAEVGSIPLSSHGTTQPHITLPPLFHTKPSAHGLRPPPPALAPLLSSPDCP